MSGAARLATVPLDRTRIAQLARWQVPFVRLSDDRIDYAATLPSPHIVGVFLQGLRDITIVLAVRNTPTILFPNFWAYSISQLTHSLSFVLGVMYTRSVLAH